MSKAGRRQVRRVQRVHDGNARPVSRNNRNSRNGQRNSSGAGRSNNSNRANRSNADSRSEGGNSRPNRQNGRANGRPQGRLDNRPNNRFGGGRPQNRQNNRGGRGKSRKPADISHMHESNFIRAAQPVKQETYTPKNMFDDFKVSDRIKANLAKAGFVQPSPIQDKSIPVSLTGIDVVGVASTGTGKTAAFAIPVLEKLINNPQSRAIIMAPTRELAMQIEEQCKIIGKGTGIFGALLIGGSPMRPQLRDLQRNPQIIIGTPGRITDHIERGTLTVDDVDVAVLDEVDRMLDMGFVHDMRRILAGTSPQRQNLFFSATMDARVRGLIQDFANKPMQITVASNRSSDNVNQNVVRFSQETKVDTLHDILIRDEVDKTIIFEDTHRSVDRLSKELKSRGFEVDAIHGGKNQSQRKRVLNSFKDDKIKILVATDVASRGLDVSDISHVINYTLPTSYEDYIHRIGRTGRAGKTGDALTFLRAK